MRDVKRPPKVRVSFDFSQEVYSHLEEMRVRLNADTEAEVIRRALSLLDYTTGKVENGCEIIIRDSDGTERIVVVS